MGFLKNLFKRKNQSFDFEDEDYEYEQEWENWGENDPGEIKLEVPENFDDKQLREAYVKACLEKIADASRELENLQFEYDMVTSNLKDMEEIEALPKEESALLKDCAKKVQATQSSYDSFADRKHAMTDERFHKMERIIDDVEEGIGKLKEAEDYQELVRKDLSRLDGERHAYYYRKAELEGAILDTRGMTIIVVTALGMCMLLLLVLHFLLDMDTQLGYLLTAGVAALAITIIYVKHLDSKKELRRVELTINKIILLQNKVKIRYVNNTNLLDYLYMKYDVKSASQLEEYFNQFNKEKEEREKSRKAELDLDYYQQELLKILRRYQVKDPTIWLHQTEAILDHKEMVEIRHGLIIRRQSLRRRMDYNKDVVAGGGQKEIKALVNQYPRYASEIMELVEKYEKLYK